MQQHGGELLKPGVMGRVVLTMFPLSLSRPLVTVSGEQHRLLSSLTMLTSTHSMNGRLW